MTEGSSQGLFVIVAVVIFGIFVFMAYVLFQDKMSVALASIFEDSTEQAQNNLLMSFTGDYGEEVDIGYPEDNIGENNGDSNGGNGSEGVTDTGNDNDENNSEVDGGLIPIKFESNVDNLEDFDGNTINTNVALRTLSIESGLSNFYGMLNYYGLTFDELVDNLNLNLSIDDTDLVLNQDYIITENSHDNTNGIMYFVIVFLNDGFVYSPNFALNLSYNIDTDIMPVYGEDYTISSAYIKYRLAFNFDAEIGQPNYGELYEHKIYNNPQ